MAFVSFRGWKTRRGAGGEGLAAAQSEDLPAPLPSPDRADAGLPQIPSPILHSLPHQPAQAERVRSSAQANPWGRLLIIGVGGGAPVFATLAFGAVHPWAFFSAGWLVGGLSLVLLGWALVALLARPGTIFSAPAPPLGWLVVALGLILLLQILALPQGLVHWLSPGAVKIRALGNGFALGEYLPLSLKPYGTGLEMLKIGPAVGLFFVLIYATGSRRQILALAVLILSLAMFEVVYGFYHLHSRLIWGWYNPYDLSRLCGTFINSNCLGALLTMALLLGFGLFLAQSPPLPARPEGLAGWRGLKRWTRVEYLEPYSRRFLLIFPLVILAVGVIFTGSRGALLSLVLGFALMGLLVWGQGRSLGSILSLAIFLAASFLYSLWLGGGHFLVRFAKPEDIGRYYAYKGALTLFREFPWLGSGLGTFGDLFYRYEPARFQGVAFFYTHNDWLQMLAETGIIGFTLVAVGWWTFYIGLIRQWRRRKDRFAWGLGLGGLAALGAGTFHALGDFPFHIPALSLVFAGIAALTYLSVHHHHQPASRFSYPVIKVHPGNRRAVLLVLAGLMTVQLALLGLAGRFWQAERVASTEMDSTRLPRTLKIEDFRLALAYNKSNSRYYLGLAEALEKNGSLDAGTLGEVESSLKSAVCFSPAHWGYRLRLGEFYLRHFRQAPEQYVSQGLRELAAAVSLFPESGRLHWQLATYLAWAEEGYPGLVPPDLRGSQGWHFEQAVRLDPSLKKDHQ
jgi:O-antigen ligase